MFNRCNRWIAAVAILFAPSVAQAEESSDAKEARADTLPECCVNSVASYSRADVLKVLNRTAALTKKMDKKSISQPTKSEKETAAGDARNTEAVSKESNDSDNATRAEHSVAKRVVQLNQDKNEGAASTLDVPEYCINTSKDKSK